MWLRGIVYAGIAVGKQGILGREFLRAHGAVGGGGILVLELASQVKRMRGTAIGVHETKVIMNRTA